MRGIETCQRFGVEFNCLVLVNRLTGDHAQDILDFFLDRGISFLQFIPCVELDPDTGRPAEVSVTPAQYGDFLCQAFDRWLEVGPTHLSIRDFDSMVNYCVTGAHTICTFGRQCADYIVIEHRGDAYPCDFFVTPDCCLGNIMDTPIEKLAASAAKRQFARQKQRMHNSCLVCSYLDMCRGGCMKDRIPLGQQTGIPRSYLCEGYRRFFAHAQPRLTHLAADLNAQLRSGGQA
jgi:uncharacterized protein